MLKENEEAREGHCCEASAGTNLGLDLVHGVLHL